MKLKLQNNAITFKITKFKYGKALFLMILLGYCFAGRVSAQNSKDQNRAGKKQLVKVSGQVSDENGTSLIGVVVKLENTNISAVTDPNGMYSILVPEDGELDFTFIGYVEQEIPVKGQKIINVKLLPANKALNEIIVTGYSTEKKKDIIGSVSVVSPKDLLATPSSNITSQLQGRAPGITVGTDGAPGSIAKVRIRGFGSFGGSDPLYVIDGVAAGESGINNLNPDDIESLQVLKDAASASVYGARAANGVIIITTKKGKKGKPKLTFDSYGGVSYFPKSAFPSLLNAQQYGELYWKEMAGAGLKPGDASWGHPQYGNGPTPVIPQYIYVNDNGTRYGGATLEGLRTSDPTLFSSLTNPANYDQATHQIVKSANTNWFAEVFKPAPIQNYQVGVSGGSDYGNYDISLGYFDQVSTATKYSYYKRYTVRSNSSFNIRPWLKIGENAQLSYTLSNLFSVSSNNGTNISSAYVMSPLIPVYDIAGNPAGSVAPGLVAVSDNGVGNNPVTTPYLHRFDNNAQYGIFGNTYLEADLVKGLTARTSFGIDYSNASSSVFNPITYSNFQNTDINNLNINTGNSNTWTWTNTLTYSKTIADKHNFKLLLGTEAIKTYTQDFTGSRTNYQIENDPNFLTLNAGTGVQTNSGFFARNTLYSMFSRLDYSFADKYLFNATIRADQSSKFAANTRTGYFPAAAIGWRLTSEEFLKHVSWLNDLKLRASWGIIGNQNGLSSENQYTILVDNIDQTYPLNGNGQPISNSYTVLRKGNSSAKWEQNQTTNFGVDASMFNDRLDFTFEWYNKTTKGLLVPDQLPLTGLTIDPAYLPSINAGDVSNKGIDLGITTRGGSSNGLRYEFGITYSQYRNKVTKVLDNPLATLNGGKTREGYANLTKVGLPISSFYGYQIDGFFNTQAEVDAYNTKVSSSWIPPAVGRWRIKDVNGDGVINSLDRTYLGSPHPKFEMGFNFSLSYKNFDVSGFLYWKYGNQIYNQAKYNTDFNTFQFNRSTTMLNDSWTPALGNNAKLPILDLSDTYSSANVSSYFVENASFLRLKTFQIGYTFPKSMLSKIKVEKLRVYVQATNLFTVTKFSGLDPDASFYGGGQDASNASDIGMGVVNGTTPTPHQIIFGINIGF